MVAWYRSYLMYLSALFYVDCNSESAILKSVNPNNLPERRRITAIIGCVPQNHTNAHSDVVVLCTSTEVKAVAGSVQCDLHFLLVFRIGGQANSGLEILTRRLTRCSCCPARAMTAVSVVGFFLLDAPLSNFSHRICLPWKSQ